MTPFFDLLARLWVAGVFLRSGILKIQNWPGTLFLFQNEFHVPFISPYWAAVIATSAELILPILLLLGLGSRIVILIFFIYNLISAISYPFLWTSEGASALNQHIVWGLLLGLLMCHGSGKLSVDYLIHKGWNDQYRKILPD
jgi:putative oxidoreductase